MEFWLQAMALLCLVFAWVVNLIRVKECERRLDQIFEWSSHDVRRLEVLEHHINEVEGRGDARARRL
jgi:hypothetical protein